jgi:hypothetical protein
MTMFVKAPSLKGRKPKPLIFVYVGVREGQATGT